MRHAVTIYVLWFCQPCHLDPHPNIGALARDMSTSRMLFMKRMSISSLNRWQSRVIELSE